MQPIMAPGGMAVSIQGDIASSLVKPQDGIINGYKRRSVETEWQYLLQSLALDDNQQANMQLPRMLEPAAEPRFGTSAYFLNLHPRVHPPPPPPLSSSCQSYCLPASNAAMGKFSK